MRDENQNQGVVDRSATGNAAADLECTLDRGRLVTVGGFGGSLQFAVSLVEEFLGLLRVTIHIPLVGFLRGHNLAISLIAEALRGSDIRVAIRVYIALRRSLRDGDAGGCETQAQKASYYPLMCKLHV